MPPQRGRACETCHLAKLRCEVSFTEGGISPPCQRCVQLGKDCVPSAPRRLRDRIVELQERVQELSERLEQAEGSTSTTIPTDSKKRKLDVPDHEQRSSDPHTNDILDFVDSWLSLDAQQKIIDTYCNEIVPMIPLVPLPNFDFHRLRNNSPILFLAILAFPTSGTVSDDIRDELVSKTTEVFGQYVIAKGVRSMEILQALLITCFWFRAPSKAKHTSFFQLISLAVNMCVDLGLAGPGTMPAVGAGFSIVDDPTSLDCRRLWLACFVATASIPTVIRKADLNVWTPYHWNCLHLLMTSPDALPTDALFCQIVWGEQICHRIVMELDHYGSSPPKNLGDPMVERQISQLRQDIEYWGAQVPQDLRTPLVLFLQDVALVYLNESILHTMSNKHSFSAAFVADHIDRSDFAAPEVSLAHIAGLYALKDACQSAIENALKYNPLESLTQTSLSYVPRVKYIVLILFRLYVALSAPGNSYGTIMNRYELNLEDIYTNIQALARTMKQKDPTAWQGRILYANTGGGEKFEEYKTMIDQHEQATNMAGFATLPLYGIDFFMPSGDMLKGGDTGWEGQWSSIDAGHLESDAIVGSTHKTSGLYAYPT